MRIWMHTESDGETRIGGNHFRRLFLFRSTIILIELAAVLLARDLLNVMLPVMPMLAVVGVHAAFNLLVWWRLKSGASASAIEFFLHLSVDVLALAVLLYFSGGSGNPFVSMFLLPLVIVAAALPRRYVWAMAAVTLGCYTLLIAINVPLSPGVGGAAMHGAHTMVAGSFSLHVLGMWFSFLLGVGLIIFFVVSMAESLRERDQRLAEAREKHLRDEHMVALGTLAAGAAHELATPLSTMAVLTREMENEYADSPDLLARLGILRSQVDRCKGTLRQISESADQMKAESGHRESLDRYLRACIDRWQELHPDCAFSADVQGSEPAPVIVVDETLNQALINLLNNAADASPERITLSGEWSESKLALELRDFGGGFSGEALERLGQPFFTTKRDGHGLGFYLASEVIRRLGGEVTVSNHPDGGALISIRLPLDKLRTE